MGRNGRGGRGGGGGGGADIEPVKLAVSVEANTNSLVLTGPAYLQDKVIEIVQQLDLPELQEKQFIQVIPIGGKINPELHELGSKPHFPPSPPATAAAHQVRVVRRQEEAPRVHQTMLVDRRFSSGSNSEPCKAALALAVARRNPRPRRKHWWTGRPRRKLRWPGGRGGR